MNNSEAGRQEVGRQEAGRQEVGRKKLVDRSAESKAPKFSISILLQVLRTSTLDFSKYSNPHIKRNKEHDFEKQTVHKAPVRWSKYTKLL